jgi:WXG100 family type VII secretion target
VTSKRSLTADSWEMSDLSGTCWVKHTDSVRRSAILEPSSPTWGYGMSGGFDATPLELRICGSMLDQISAEVRDRTSVLQGEADALLSDGWQGGAAQGFAQGWQQWRAGAGEVLAALESMGQLLDTTGQNYVAVDDRSADGVRQSGEGL